MDNVNLIIMEARSTSRSTSRYCHIDKLRYLLFFIYHCFACLSAILPLLPLFIHNILTIVNNLATLYVHYGVERTE